MNRWDATEIFRTLINSIAKDGRIFYHGKYVELISSAVRASIKVDDEFDAIKGSREYDFTEGMKFSDESNFIKSERTNNFTLVNVQKLLQVYKDRPLKKNVGGARPLSITPTRLLLTADKLAVQITFDGEVLQEKNFFSCSTNLDTSMDITISSHSFQKILAFSAKICDKIGLRLFADYIQITTNSKDLNILWQLPKV